MAITQIESKKFRVDILINYVMNPDKTEKMKYVSAINCSPETAIKDMNDTKNRYGKKSGTTAYHLIQSFDGFEVTPEQAQDLGYELATDIFGLDYEIVIATHVNTKNIHNHIIINSVSYRTGYKFEFNRESRDYIRITSDLICKEHNLKVIDTVWKYKGYYKLYVKNDPYIQMVKSYVDRLASESFYYKQYQSKLAELGLKDYIDENIGYAIYDTKTEKTIRLEALFGEDYSYEHIKQKILYLPSKNHNNRNYPNVKVYTMSNEEYKKFIAKREFNKILKLPKLYVLLCLLLKIDPIPSHIEYKRQ